MAEKTPEQIEKEKQIAKQKEEWRNIALKNLGSALWNYAAPKLITAEQYGALAQSSKGFYDESISKTPDQSIYEQVFLPQLAKEGGAVTTPYVQDVSLKILQQSFLGVKVGEAAKYFGVSNVKESLKDKYVSDLGEKEATQIVFAGMQYQTDETVKRILSMRQKDLSSGLEKILTEPPKEPKK